MTFIDRNAPSTLTSDARWLSVAEHQRPLVYISDRMRAGDYPSLPRTRAMRGRAGLPTPPGLAGIFSTSTPSFVQGLSLDTTAIVAGLAHACAAASGTTYCWGANAYGQLGNGSTIASSVAIASTGLATKRHDHCSWQAPTVAPGSTDRLIVGVCNVAEQRQLDS